MPEWLQYAIAALLVLAVLWTARRNGQQNPETTGQQSKQIRKLFADVNAIKAKLEHAVTKAELAAISADLRSLEAHAASSGEMTALEGKINGLRGELEGTAATLQAKLDGSVRAIEERVAGVKEMSDRTYTVVARMDSILVEMALKGDRK